ncbi:unnamed protein product [Owenia fusiformis]|uniref:Transmembrane protein 180 n=1 Tax=Owenia fusiformis TaxID=6347 RepID=A0A8S4NRM5_OWEFU|nr:unnamed protein product [Owenia fusiformis]
MFQFYRVFYDNEVKSVYNDDEMSGLTYNKESQTFHRSHSSTSKEDAPSTRCSGSGVPLTLGVCYGSIALFSAVLHNVFLLYHIETFVSIYKINKASFWIGETVFLLWNSLNDPLFGWLSDKGYLNSKGNTTQSAVILHRLRALSWNGPLLGIAFLGFWFAWGNPTVQFILCLCIYDGFLTMVDLHHSALLADLAVSAKTRTRLNFYCSVFMALGSLSVFLSYTVWNRESFASFQFFCAGLSAFSIVGFLCSTTVLRRFYVQKSKNEENENEESHFRPSGHVETSSEVVPKASKFYIYIKQLATQKNFIWFAGMNLIQVFHCHFNSNFFPLFLENLLGDAITPSTGSILLGVSFVAPHFNNLYFLTLCRKYGVYKVIQWLFYVKLLLSGVMLTVGPNNIPVLCLFIASNRVFTEGTCKLLNLVISDLVDEDYVLHSRKQAVSALMFGTAALVSKPGQTLAPLIGTWLLTQQTGHDIFKSGDKVGSIKMDIKDMTLTDQTTYKTGCFHLLIYVPIACAILQILAWSQFSLHGKRLRWVKAVRAGAHYATV